MSLKFENIGNGRAYNADCFEVMKEIPDGSVDLILADLPYGTTACKWDAIIPFEEMWVEFRRVVKTESSIIALFCSEPFTSNLIVSNLKGFKYRLDWDKIIPSGMSYARFRPMQQTEDIAIFTKNGGRSIYIPQMVKRDVPIKSGGVKKSESAPIAHKDPNFKKVYTEKNPTTLLKFSKIRKGSLHPTQKPVDLCEYLIKTYTNEGDLVFDPTAGSLTTAVAAQNTSRKWIVSEQLEEYFTKGIARFNK